MKYMKIFGKLCFHIIVYDLSCRAWWKIRADGFSQSEEGQEINVLCGQFSFILILLRWPVREWGWKRLIESLPVYDIHAFIYLCFYCIIPFYQSEIRALKSLGFFCGDRNNVCELVSNCYLSTARRWSGIRFWIFKIVFAAIHKVPRHYPISKSFFLSHSNSTNSYYLYLGSAAGRCFCLSTM